MSSRKKADSSTSWHIKPTARAVIGGHVWDSLDVAGRDERGPDAVEVRVERVEAAEVDDAR